MSGHLHAVRVSSSYDPQGRRTRVVLADDHASLRRNFRLLLEREGDVAVVAEASDMDTAVRLVAAHRPDVLVLDLHLPDGSNSERIEALRVRFPRTGIVVVTMQDSAMFAEQAIGAGALGFVVTDRADQELPDAVRRASLGYVYQSPQVRRP